MQIQSPKMVAQNGAQNLWHLAETQYLCIKMQNTVAQNGRPKRVSVAQKVAPKVAQKVAQNGRPKWRPKQQLEPFHKHPSNVPFMWSTSAMIRSLTSPIPAPSRIHQQLNKASQGALGASLGALGDVGDTLGDLVNILEGLGGILLVDMT